MRRKFLYLLLFGSLLGVAACDNNDGPLERAGETADEAVDDLKDAGDEIKDAGEEIKDAVDPNN